MTSYVPIVTPARGVEVRNSLGRDIEAGERFVINNLLLFSEDSIVDGDHGFLAFNEGPSVIREVYLGNAIGTSYKFGDALSIDGQFLGYVVPHPDEDPKDMDPAAIVVPSSSKVIRYVGARSGSPVTTTIKEVGPVATVATEIVPTTTAAALQTLLNTAQTTAGGTVSVFSAVANSTAGNIDGDVLLNPATLTALAEGSAIEINVIGGSDFTYTNPVTSQLLTINSNDMLTVRRYGAQLRISG